MQFKFFKISDAGFKSGNRLIVDYENGRFESDFAKHVQELDLPEGARVELLDETLEHHIRTLNLGDGIYTSDPKKLAEMLSRELKVPSLVQTHGHIETELHRLRKEALQAAAFSGPEEIQHHAQLMIANAESPIAGLAWVVENMLHPIMRKMHEQGSLPTIELEDLDLKVVRGWNYAATGKAPENSAKDHKHDDMWAWIGFTSQMKEVMIEKHPDLMIEIDEKCFFTYGKHDSLREPFAKAAMDVCMPLLLEGNLPAAYSDSSKCEETHEYLQFGIEGFEPILLDMNDNLIEIKKSYKIASTDLSM